MPVNTDSGSEPGTEFSDYWVRRPWTDQENWWRRWESNPRPKVFSSRIYVRIRFRYIIRKAMESGKRTSRTSLSTILNDPLKETESPKIPLNDVPSRPAG